MICKDCNERWGISDRLDFNSDEEMICPACMIIQLGTWQAEIGEFEENCGEAIE